jgi:hypothetical protein
MGGRHGPLQGKHQGVVCNGKFCYGDTFLDIWKIQEFSGDFGKLNTTEDKEQTPYHTDLLYDIGTTPKPGNPS